MEPFTLRQQLTQAIEVAAYWNDRYLPLKAQFDARFGGMPASPEKYAAMDQLLVERFSYDQAQANLKRLQALADAETVVAASDQAQINIAIAQGEITDPVILQDAYLANRSSWEAEAVEAANAASLAAIYAQGEALAIAEANAVAAFNAAQQAEQARLAAIEQARIAAETAERRAQALAEAEAARLAAEAERQAQIAAEAEAARIAAEAEAARIAAAAEAARIAAEAEIERIAAEAEAVRLAALEQDKTRVVDAGGMTTPPAAPSDTTTTTQTTTTRTTMLNLPSNWDTFSPAQKIAWFNLNKIKPSQLLAEGVTASDIAWMRQNGYTVQEQAPATGNALPLLLAAAAYFFIGA